MALIKKPVNGMKDILPREMEIRDYLIALIKETYGQFGFQTSRVANDALTDGVHVDPANLQPGDLLCFYSGNNYVGHLGIYVGDDLFIHAANSVTGVVTTSLTTGYYASRGYEIRRII